MLECTAVNRKIVSTKKFKYSSLAQSVERAVWLRTVNRMTEFGEDRQKEKAISQKIV